MEGRTGHERHQKAVRHTENLQADKIVNSMRGAGIPEDAARLVAAEFKHHDGINIVEVRRRVIDAIKNREPQAAKRYESHPRKLHAKCNGVGPNLEQ